jgi:hypothetical protein
VEPQWINLLPREEREADDTVEVSPNGVKPQGGGVQPVAVSSSSSPPRPRGVPSSPPVPASAAAESESEEEFEVEGIVGQRERRGVVEYKVKWVGDYQPSWEPEGNLKCEKLLEKYKEEQKSQVSMVFQVTAPPTSAALSSVSASSSVSPSVSVSSVVSAVLGGADPISYRQAILTEEKDKWEEAVDVEDHALEKFKVFDVVDQSEVPRGAIVMQSKDVPKVKRHLDGSVDKYKWRICVLGDQQPESSYDQTFSPTGMGKALRLLVSYAASTGSELDQFDVSNAFLQAPLEKGRVIYVRPPPSVRERPKYAGKLWKLNKAMYGLKQAPRDWNIAIVNYLVRECSFRQAVSDPCVFSLVTKGGRLLIIWLYVDDGAVVYHPDDKAEWEMIKGQLAHRFEVKHMGASQHLLGMQVSRDRKAGTITLDQEGYVEKVLHRFGMKEVRSVDTPVIAGPECVGDADGADGVCDREVYQAKVGSLMYAAVNTRPDISYAVQRLAQQMQAPLQRHMVAADRVLRYLSGCKGLGLVFGARKQLDACVDTSGASMEVSAFADSDYASSVDRKSISGYLVRFNGDLICWSSKKQRLVSLSSCEAELYAEAACVQEVLWVRGMIEELGLKVAPKSVVHGDNQSTLEISTNGIKRERTKHVDVKYHFVTETVERGLVKLRWVPTAQQQADILTKALGTSVFLRLRSQLLMTC